MTSITDEDSLNSLNRLNNYYFSSMQELNIQPKDKNNINNINRVKNISNNNNINSINSNNNTLTNTSNIWKNYNVSDYWK